MEQCTGLSSSREPISINLLPRTLVLKVRNKNQLKFRPSQATNIKPSFYLERD